MPVAMDADSKVTPQMLLAAYARGIFPMARERDTSGFYWMRPEQRGVIFLDRVHIPRRLARTVRQDRFEVVIDRDFPSVVNACAGGNAARPRSWINADICVLYQALFESGHCHSIEVREGGQLVGGLYGVVLGQVFFGESMFAHRRDASKIAFVHLAARLVAGHYRFIDTQFVTAHLEQFGVVELSNARFLELLGTSLGRQGDFHAIADVIGGRQALEILQPV